MPEMKRSPKFHVGDLVRVKHGVADVDYPDIPMGGWVGRITKIEGMCLVRWSTETLENVHPVYRKRCERDGLDEDSSWLAEEDLEWTRSTDEVSLEELVLFAAWLIITVCVERHHMDWTPVKTIVTFTLETIRSFKV